MKEQFIFCGKEVSNQTGTASMLGAGILLLAGACLLTPVLIPTHLILRMRGLKGIYRRDGYLINLDGGMFNPIKK